MLSAKVALQKQGAERPITLPMYLDHTVGGIEHWFTGLVWVLTGRFLTLKKDISSYGIFIIKEKVYYASKWRHKIQFYH